MERYEGPLLLEVLLTRLHQVLDTNFIHREEGRGGTILWTHVGNGSSVSDGQLAYSGPEELDKFSHYPNLAEVLSGRMERCQSGWTTSKTQNYHLIIT